MGKPNVDEQAEYLKTVALVIGKAPSPQTTEEYKTVARHLFRVLCDLHEELLIPPGPGE